MILNLITEFYPDRDTMQVFLYAMDSFLNFSFCVFYYVGISHIPLDSLRD